MDTYSIFRILSLIAEYDINGEIFWSTDFEFFVNCNDVFFWGCADAEPISAETLDDLEKALKETELDGCNLYCARRREMRPQGALYKYLEKKNWPLFDACGPKRDVGFGNPTAHPLDIDQKS